MIGEGEESPATGQSVNTAGRVSLPGRRPLLLSGQERRWDVDPISIEVTIPALTAALLLVLLLARLWPQ